MLDRNRLFDALDRLAAAYVAEQYTEPVPSGLDRLTAADISRDRIDEHLPAGRVRLDSEPVTDLQTPAAPPARGYLAET